MTPDEEFKIVRQHVLSQIPDGKPGMAVAFYTSLDDLTRAHMRYMKTCLSCGSRVQPCCGH